MLTTCKPEEEIVAYEMDAYHAFSGQCTAIDIDSMLPNRNSQYFRLVRGWTIKVTLFHCLFANVVLSTLLNSPERFVEVEK